VATSAVVDDFQKRQYAFAAHLRDPAAHPAPEGLEDRRVAVYRELFYNNVEQLLAGNFPVIRRITPDARWHALVRGFYAHHASHTPLFTEIGREFHRYLEARAEAGADDPPFLAELAHYEYAELAVSLDESDLAAIACDPDGDVVTGVPVPSPTAWPLAYRFPVHQVREDFQPVEAPPEPTVLIVARNRADEVGFMQINPLSLRLLELVKENPAWTGLECIEAVAALFPAEQRAALVEAGKGLMQGFRARDVLLGTRIA
jgi:uncharacterized protein